MPPDIAASQREHNSPGMFRNMAGNQNQIVDHRPDPPASYRMFCLRSPFALNGILSDDTQDVIGKYGELQYKLVGIELPGREPFHVHVRLDLAMVLFTLTMCMVKLNDGIIGIAQVRPERVDLNVSRKQELPVFVYRTLNHFVYDAHSDGLFLTIAIGVRDIFPAAPNIDGLPGTRITDVFTAVFDFVQPILLELSASGSFELHGFR